MPSQEENAVVVGVGPGLGWHLAARFAAAGLQVTAAARDREKLERLIAEGAAEGTVGRIRAAACDATDAATVERLFAEAEAKQGAPDLVVFNAGAFKPGSLLDLEPAEVERCWRIGCLAGLQVAQAALQRMLPRGRGTIIFTGATASLRGSANFAALAIPKFGLRALAQSMAREFGPQGIHVAHVVIDGQIASERHAGRAAETLLDPAAIAENYYRLYRQDPTAWTQELDLRPAVERF